MGCRLRRRLKSTNSVRSDEQTEHYRKIWARNLPGDGDACNGIAGTAGIFCPAMVLPVRNSEPGILVWSPLLTIACVLIIFVLGEISDRLIIKIFNSASQLAMQTLQTLLTFLVMLGCYRLVMMSYQAVLIAAVTATLGNLILTPLINGPEKNASRSER